MKEKSKNESRIPLYPLFEAALGIGEIDNKKDLDIVIKVLEEIPEEEGKDIIEYLIKNHKEIREKIKKRKKERREKDNK